MVTILQTAQTSWLSGEFKVTEHPGGKVYSYTIYRKHTDEIAAGNHSQDRGKIVAEARRKWIVLNGALETYYTIKFK